MKKGLITFLLRDEISLFQQNAVQEGFDLDADL
jgi:hypothetical protein